MRTNSCHENSSPKQSKLYHDSTQSPEAVASPEQPSTVPQGDEGTTPPGDPSHDRHSTDDILPPVESDFERIWQDMLPHEKREVILANWPAEAWCDEDNLNVLAVFYDDPIQWMRIKARAKAIGVNTFDLERAVKAIRTRHNVWKQSITTNGVVPNASVVDPVLGVIDWRSALLLNQRHEPCQTAGNYRLFLAHDPIWQGTFWWDSVRYKPMVGDKPLDDKIVVDIALWLQTHEPMNAWAAAICVCWSAVFRPNARTTHAISCKSGCTASLLRTRSPTSTPGFPP